MHVPKGGLKDCEIVPFTPELADASLPGTDYDAARWLYMPNHYGEYRYILGTRGEKPLYCIGINPSTAAPDRLDNTLKSVGRIARHNGYDSYIMLNVCAQRATRPDDMAAQHSRLLHRENLRAFEYALSLAADGKPAIWAAWGTVIESRGYLRPCLLDMLSLAEKYHAQWYTAGSRSKKGHPHHPLYLRQDCELQHFQIWDYCASFK